MSTEPSNDRDVRKVVRWAAVFLLVVGGVAVVASGREICRSEIASVGTNPTTRVCGPPELTDLVVVGWLIFIVLLIWPDLQEVAFPGGFSLKRQVKQQAEKLDQQGEQLNRLTNELHQISLQSQTTNVDMNAPDMAGVLKEIPDLVERLAHQRTVPALEAAMSGSDVIPARRAQLESKLLRLWAKLEPLIGYAKQAPALRSYIDTPTSGGKLHGAFVRMFKRGLGPMVEALERWSEDFSREIKVVHTTRDAIASGKAPDELTDDKLESVVQVAAVLLSALQDRIQDAQDRESEESKEGEHLEAKTTDKVPATPPSS